MKSTLPILALLATASPLLAIQDSNSNGLSDVWEKFYNDGNLFSGGNPNHATAADPDADGWTNADEAVAGTDPFSAALPAGWVRTSITNHPESNGLFLLSWPSTQGKSYQLSMSTDLSAWADCGGLIAGTGSDIELALDCQYEVGGTPERMFWRVRVADEDPDGDTLTSWEELVLGTDPYHPDSDLDGIFDGVDAQPFSSATLADPDGLGLPASLDNGLIGRWDFEQIIDQGGIQVFPDLAGGDHPLTSSTQQGLALRDMSMISKGVRLYHVGDYLEGPASLVGNRSAFSFSFWVRTERDFLSDFSPTAVIFAYSQSQTATPEFLLTVESGTNFGDPQSLVFRHTDGSPQPDWTLPLPPGFQFDSGRWQQLVLIKKPTSLEIHLNGSLLGSMNTSVVWGAGPTAFLSFGNTAIDGTNPGDALWGAFDRTRFYDRPLTGAEIDALYHQDSDGDGLWDLTEVNSSHWIDSNWNYLPDPGEWSYAASPFEWQFPDTDSDGDGVADLTEQAIGTAIDRTDSDEDLLPDGWELGYGLDGTVPDATDANANGLLDSAEYPDSDGDGLTTLDEYRFNTNPNLADTDGDGVNDGDEISGGSDPNNPDDGGQPPGPEQMQEILLGIGDESGSESEDYVLHCYKLDPESGSETRVFTLRSGGYGEYKDETVSNVFRKGVTYTFQIEWQGSSLSRSASGSGEPGDGPDFDYTFKVEPQGANFGFLVQSWDSETKTLDTSRTILAEDASDVADDPEEFRGNYQQRRVVLLPMPTYSADRMFAASIHLPLGFEGLSFRIENAVTGHDFGTHHHLLGAPSGAGVEGPAAAKVYQSIDGMFGPEDADGYAVQETRVWFMRSADPEKPGRIEMYLVSPEDPVHGYGKIEITPMDGETELGSVERDLTPDQEMADVIEAAAKVASGEGFDFCTDENWQLPGFGQGLAVPEEWATPMLIPFLTVAFQIEGMTLVGTGIIEGVVNGFIDDCRLVEGVLNLGVVATGWAHQAVLAELQEWRDNPRTRLKELKNATAQFFKDSICTPVSQYVEKTSTIDGFRDALWDTLYVNPLTGPAKLGHKLGQEHGAVFTQSIWESLDGWFGDFGNRMVEGAERNAWINLPLDTAVLEAGGTQLAREQAYTFGYTLGYLCEQVAVGVATVGVSKYAQAVKVGGSVLAGQLASRTLGAIATRATILKKWFASAAISIELRLAIEEGITVAGRTALPAAGNRVVLEVIEDGLESFGANRSLMNWQVLMDDVLAQPRLLQVFQVPGYEAKYLEATASLVHRLGATTTPQAMRQWPRLCNALAPVNEGAIADDVLRTGDLFTALKFETPQGQQVMKELLESLEGKTAAEILDGPALPASIKNIYPTMYHYADRGTLIDFATDNVDGVVGKWRLHTHQGSGRYVGVEDIAPQAQVQSQFQLPLEQTGTTWTPRPNKGRFRCVTPTADDLVLPRADRHSADSGIGAKSWLESIVKDNPNCGAGGQSQFKSWQEVIVEVYDTETGQLVRDKEHLVEILSE